MIKFDFLVVAIFLQQYATIAQGFSSPEPYNLTQTLLDVGNVIIGARNNGHSVWFIKHPNEQNLKFIYEMAQEPLFWKPPATPYNDAEAIQFGSVAFYLGVLNKFQSVIINPRTASSKAFSHFEGNFIGDVHNKTKPVVTHGRRGDTTAVKRQDRDRQHTHYDDRTGDTITINQQNEQSTVIIERSLRAAGQSVKDTVVESLAGAGITVASIRALVIKFIKGQYAGTNLAQTLGVSSTKDEIILNVQRRLSKLQTKLDDGVQDGDLKKMLSQLEKYRGYQDRTLLTQDESIKSLATKADEAIAAAREDGKLSETTLNNALQSVKKVQAAIETKLAGEDASVFNCRIPQKKALVFAESGGDACSFNPLGEDINGGDAVAGGGDAVAGGGDAAAGGGDVAAGEGGAVEGEDDFLGTLGDDFEYALL